MTSLDSLEELRTFALVVEAGSLSAAARRLQVTANAVSRRLMRLEDNLGVKVLRRSTRAVSVTDEGRRLYERARRALAEIDAAEEELRGARGSLQGALRVAIPGGTCSASVLAGIGRLLDAHPELRLEVRIVNREIDPVAGGFDIALHVGPPPDSRLVARKLLTASWALCAAPSYLAKRSLPKRPSDLREHRCLRLAADRPQHRWRLVDAKGRVHEVEVSGTFEADDSRALGDATYAGIGIGIRPRRELAAAIDQGRLVHVLPAYRFEPLDVHALLSPGASRLPRVAQVLQSLKDVLRELE